MNEMFLPRDYTTVPTVLKRSVDGERAYDLFSRLLEDRIIMFTGEVNADTAQIAIAELLYLASVDDSKDITMYINSPGGSVVDGLAIYDTMRYIKPDVSTVVVGMAASMGSILLSGGAKGKRYALPNAEVMIHQPSGGSKGMASDMEIAWKQMERCKEKLTRYLVANSGRNPDNPDDYQKVLKDMDRDYWMTAQEALDYGLIDKIIELR
jgi:ATP-dependent Clp protease protease subunit